MVFTHQRKCGCRSPVAARRLHRAAGQFWPVRVVADALAPRARAAIDVDARPPPIGPAPHAPLKCAHTILAINDPGRGDDLNSDLLNKAFDAAPSPSWQNLRSWSRSYPARMAKRSWSEPPASWLTPCAAPQAADQATGRRWSGGRLYLISRASLPLISRLSPHLAMPRKAH